MNKKVNEAFLPIGLAVALVFLILTLNNYSDIYDYSRKLLDNGIYKTIKSKFKSTPKDKYTIVFKCSPPFDAQLKLLLGLYQRQSFDNVAILQIDSVLNSTRGYCHLTNEEVLVDADIKEIKDNIYFIESIGSSDGSGNAKITGYYITTKLFKLYNGQYARFGVVEESYIDG